MRAMAFTDFGADLEATDLPVPEPGPGEVLVQVLAPSVNGFDLGVLGGYLKDSGKERWSAAGLSAGLGR
ncbi:hypothetical protein AB0H88_41445 [Nonomuraea sp. NPDC050680]|uniref:hypothetical protein n=1 Tax=Nonomuraea sp. NPDC050680 TaxID=3154630 RepID=UPI0033CB7691